MGGRVTQTGDYSLAARTQIPRRAPEPTLSPSAGKQLEEQGRRSGGELHGNAATPQIQDMGRSRGLATASRLPTAGPVDANDQGVSPPNEDARRAVRLQMGSSGSIESKSALGNSPQDFYFRPNQSGLAGDEVAQQLAVPGAKIQLENKTGRNFHDGVDPKDRGGIDIRAGG